MLRKTLMLLALGLLLAPVVRAQTVDEILTKHYQAEGGLEKLRAINTTRITGTLGVGPGMEAPFTMERKRPGKSRMEFSLQGMTGIRAFDGAKTWSVMPFMGKKDPEYGTDEENKNALDDADFDGTLVDWKAKGHTVELVGKESVEGADAYKLKVTKKNGKIEYHYLDAETYLLVKTEGKANVRGTEMEVETTYSDYKDVDGFMQPFAIEQGAKGMPQKQKMTFTKIEMNVPIEDSRFAFPGAPDSTQASTQTAAKAAPGVDGANGADKQVAAAKADTTRKADAPKKLGSKPATGKKKKGQ